MKLHLFTAWCLLLIPLFSHAQKKDRYYNMVKEEVQDLQIIFDYVLANNLHEGFTKKTIWLNNRSFNKEKNIRRHFNKLHIKEVVIQGNTGYKTIAPEDSVIVLKRKYNTPGLPRHEIIYNAAVHVKIYPDVQNERISFLALTNRMYYLKR